MNPATKRCHMIDFVVMRAEQRVVCRDVQVMRGTNCWTDHLLARPLRAGDSTECNWDALKSCIVPAAEEVVCRWKRKPPDWFEDSEELLSPLIKDKDDAHLRMIQCNTSASQMEFRRHQRKVKVAVDNANEEWICMVAKEGEAVKKDGCTRWKSIRNCSWLMLEEDQLDPLLS